MTRHPLLERQLRRAGLETPEPASERLIAEVDLAYKQFDADRALLERSLELTSQELLSSRRDLTAALGASRTAVWMWSPGDDQTRVEGYPSPLPGRRIGPALGPAAALLELVHAPSRDAFERSLRAALARGQEVDERVPLAADPSRFLGVQGHVDPDSGGRRLTGVLRDVTDEVVRENELRTLPEATRRLGRDLSQHWGDLQKCLRILTEVACEGLGVERVSAWLVEPEQLRLIDLYCRADRSHAAGETLPRTGNEAYFDALASSRSIVADDARTNPVTRGFGPSYLARTGIGATLDAPVRVGGELRGVICHEHVGEPRRWSVREQWFAATMADFAALAIEASARHRAERALDAQRRFLHQIIDLSPNLIFARDTDGRLTLVNRAVAELTGASFSQLVGTAGAASSMDALRVGDEEVLRTGSEHVEPEVVVEDARGERRTFQVTKRAMVDPEGVTRQVLGVATDVTERLRADETRRRLESDLRQAQKLESLGLLAGGVAHDFNNLLVPILAVAESSLESLPPDSPLARDLEDVLAAAQRGRDITAQLLAFGRKQVLELSAVELDGQLLSARRLLTRLVPENVGIELSLDARCTVRVDPTQLQQVLINLIVNARDAMPHGGTVRIATRRVPRAGGDVVELSVSDTGVGIEPEHQPRVFEPFYSTKRGGGSGLGLATTYGIVQAHGGTIRVESEVGRGARFVIELPVGERAPDGRSERPAEIERGGETILVCEDDDLVRKVLVRQLETRGGYRVVPMSSAEDALAWLTGPQGEAVDLVVTDVVLPGMSGPELIRSLDRSGRHVPRLFVSGHAHGVLAPSGVLEPGIKLLAKPFTTAELLGAVREQLDLARGYSRRRT